MEYVEKGTIDEINITPIIEELNDCAKSDIITKHILQEKYDLFFPVIKNSNLSKLTTHLVLILNHINPTKIVDESRQLFDDLLQGNKKKDLTKLLNNVVSTLINAGYSQEYLYFKVTREFFKTKKVTPTYKVGSFFSQFDFTEHEYLIYFTGDALFKDIKEICERLDIRTLKRLPKYSSKTGQLKNDVVENGFYLKLTGVKALDPYSARNTSSRKILRVTNYFSYFHHKKSPQINSKSVVVNIKSKEEKLIEAPKSSMIKGMDLRVQDAKPILKGFMESFKMTQQSSLKFARAIDLHGQALTDEIAENQILNLWIAIEMLVTQDKSTSKIANVADTLVPFLNLCYYRDIFSDLHQKIKDINEEKLDELIGKCEFEGDLQNGIKFILLIISDQAKNQRIELYNILNNFPLLKFKISQLRSNLSKADSIKSDLKRHSTKLHWHIRRLYRLRNFIVHEGKVGNNVNILVENTHYYFDSFMNGFLMLNLRDKSVLNIEQGIDLIKLINNRWLKELKEHSDTIINEKNIKKILVVH